MIPKMMFLAFFILMLIVPVYAQESDSKIPEWVKPIAAWWVEGTLPDEAFIEAVTFLAENNIIQINSTPIVNEQNNKLYDSVPLSDNDTIMTLTQQIKEKDNEIKDLKEYKTNHPNKLGNIGGQIINIENFKQMDEDLKNARDKASELQDDNVRLEKEIRALKKN